MDLPYQSTFNPFSPQFDTPQISTSCFTQFQHQDDNLVIPSSLVSQQQQQQDHHLDNLLLTIPSFAVNDVFLQGSDKTNNVINDPKKKKKIIHREIERQRRSEMSSLHASLRTLLPHDYIRGKRAMSDHLGEAVKYIKHLQQNIKALSDRRDVLKKDNKCVNNNSKPGGHEVKVNITSKGGVDVTVSTSCRLVERNDNVDGICSEGIPLSKVLQCLNQEGFDVISYISQRVDNSKLIHCIQAQVKDGRIIATDAVKLQQKLEDL